MIKAEIDLKEALNDGFGFIEVDNISAFHGGHKLLWGQFFQFSPKLGKIKITNYHFLLFN